jgi:hypothetical protein
MEKGTCDDVIRQYEFLEQEMLTEDQKRIFRIAFKMGVKDGKAQGIKEFLDFLSS